MGDANLTIIFFSFIKNIYDTIIVDKDEFYIKDQNISKTIVFNHLEKEIGKKVCNYQLINKNDKDIPIVQGTFEIYLGDNVGYCFLDTKGTAFQFSLINKNGELPNLIKNEFDISMNLLSKFSKHIKVSANKFDTKDRANLLLINCNGNEQIIFDNDKKINIEEIKKKITPFSDINGYNICFYNSNFNDFSKRKIEEIEGLNFEKIYNNYNVKITEIYNKIIEYIDNNNDSLNFKELFSEIKEPQDIIKIKFTYTNKILEKELNKDEYIEFIFRLNFLQRVKAIINENEKIDINLIKLIHKNGKKIKNQICNDNLKNYEKILLLIELNLSEIDFSKKDKIEYFNKNNLNIYSPLYMAYEFLNKFIDELEYQSNFYFPLLCIDSGLFFYNFEINEVTYHNITTYGYNMNSLSIIIDHLKGIIPNVILYDNACFLDDANEDSNTNSYTGLISLNTKKLAKEKIEQGIMNENTRKHYAFIIVRNLFHEIFGHKKSLISKFEEWLISPISFKNKLGELSFISSDNNQYHQFQKLENIVEEGISLKNCSGDSGYYLEYYFGDYNNFSITSIIDILKEKSNINFAILLDTNLWHFRIEALQKYVYFKYIELILSSPCIFIEEKLSIEEQNKILEEKIMALIKKEEEKNTTTIINDERNIDKFKKGKKGCLSLLNNEFYIKDHLIFKKEIKPLKKIKYSFFKEIKSVYRHYKH